MIVYKWVHKKGDKYYSLMNFGFTKLSEEFKTNQPPYELGKSYNNIHKEYKSLMLQFRNKKGYIPQYIKKGFYLWINKNTKPNKKQLDRMKILGGEINAVLECYISINDILSYERGNNCIRVSKMKIIREI